MPQSNQARRWRLPVILLFWLGMIFGTSCTVIRPQEFFELISSFTGAGRESKERFALFWGISWFTIVKGWHFTEFAILTLLTVAALKWWYAQITSWSIVRAMIFCIAFAASDEWHQSFVPDRFGTVQDVLIDSLGVCAAGSILLVRLNRRIANHKALHTEPQSQEVSQRKIVRRGAENAVAIGIMHMDMDTPVRLCGQIDEWPTKAKMRRLLQAAGFSVYVGQYSIRINDCEHFAIHQYGGDLGEPQFDADASTLEKMLEDAGRVSAALALSNIRHRFELYDDNNEMVGYIHHRWPQTSE